MTTTATRIRRMPARILICGGVLALLLTSCDDPVAALIGVTAVSTETLGHTHRCSIPSSDLVNPPADQNTYISTTVQGHSHRVVVSSSDLQTLNEPNGFVNVQSEPAGDPSHTHNFLFNH